LVGKEADGGAPYNADEPLPPVVAIKPPPPPKEGGASFAQVDKILEELRRLPPVRETRLGDEKLLRATNLPPFSAKTLAEYKGDDKATVTELLPVFDKDPDDFSEKQPLRGAVLGAIKALEESNKIKMRETLDGPIDPKGKAKFLAEQKEPGLMIFELEKALGIMKTVADERAKEKSKRWQANFDYTMARLEARLVYLFEYSYALGQIRSESLPELQAGQTGWRVGSRKKIQVPEPKAKQLAKDVSKIWKKIEDDYPGTPWELLARRESLIAIGLEWRAKSD